MSFIRMFIIWVSLLASLRIFMLINAQQGLYNDESLEVKGPTSETPDTLYKSRCTRRFTPGVCEGPAASVWAFVFHLQNCTERLGCAISHRTNRFPSYRQCMKRCRPLVDIYLQILAFENYTNMVYLRNQLSKTSRREGKVNLMDLNDTLDLEDNEDDKEDEEISTSEEPLFNLYYRDDSEEEISLPPDIDDVEGQNQDDVTADYLYED